MHLDCPRCGSVIEYSDKRPSFCAYCGSALGSTAPFENSPADAEGPTLAPNATNGPAERPDTVGGYRLLRELGSGGMGAVYEAEDANSGRRVAVKLLSSDLDLSADGVERFRREGRLASRISHPRCVFVLAADEDQGRPYIVMELMPGSTLADLVQKQGPLPETEAVAKILDVIDGLHEAHQHGVIHRDVKPSNCFLEADGRVKVGDFGLAKSLQKDAHLTATGSFLGTPLFASPEQVKKEPLDFRSDVYSVAATLYYLLTGKAPFEGGGDALSALARIVSDPPPPVRTLRPDISPALEKVVMRGLERQRERRWASLEAFRAALLPFVPGQLTIGTLGLRFGAYLIDGLVFLPLTSLTTVVFPQEPVAQAIEFVCDNVTWILYFALLEGIWGCSLGKRALRLRVYRVGRSDPPGPLRALVRVLILFVLVSLGQYLGSLFADYSWAETSDDGQGGNVLYTGRPWALVGLLVSLAGLGLILSTMRSRNGYRGLHEWLSGTRVVRLPWPKRRPSVASRGLDRFTPPVIQPEGLPDRLGAFQVRGALRWDETERLLLAEDTSLGREVWVWCRPGSAPPLPEARRSLSRSTRLRWLTSGQQDGWQWDAFLAPTSCPLTDVVRPDLPLSWADVRPLLQDLTEELIAARTDATIPGDLTPAQVWLQADGRVQLLDFTLPETSVVCRPNSAAADPDGRCLGFLAQVAVLALEGRPLQREPDPAAPIRAPVPGYAMRLGRRLVRLSEPYPSLDAFRADLAAVQERPTEIRRLRRVGQLAVAGTLHYVGFIVFCTSLALLAWMARDSEVRPGQYAWVRLVMIGITLTLPTVWILWAFLTRDGLSYRLVGIALVRSNGRKPSRFRCAGRALLAWGPATVLLVIGILVGNGVLAALCAGGALLVLVANVIDAVWFPSQSIRDRWLGVHLVPR